MSHKGHAAVAKVDYAASSKILAVVVTGGSINDAMKLLGEQEDFEPAQEDAELMFVHRKLAGATSIL
jgi:hypothetical protein